MSILEVFQQYSQQVSDEYMAISSHHDGHTDFSESDDYGSDHRDRHTDCDMM